MKKLSAEARAYLNDVSLIAERDMWLKRMSDIFDGRENEYNSQKVFTLHGVVPRPKNGSNLYTDPEDWVIECLETMYAERAANRLEGFTPICISYPAYGVHYVDKILGGDVKFHAGQWNTEYLKTPIGSLEMPDLDKNELWQCTKRAVETFLDADVKLPLQATPVFASALNILINLYGQDGFIAMYEDEDAVRHDLGVINELIRTMHRWFINTVPREQLQACAPWSRCQPQGYGQLCGCTMQLLGADLYREYIADLDDAILGEYENGGMIHLCGTHTQHIDTFRKMKNLRALQLNDRAVEHLPNYLEGIRDDQVLYVTPCPTMSLEKIMEISKGKKIILAANVPSPDMPG